MKHIGAPLLLCLCLLGASSMAAETQKNTLTWTDGPGQMDPAPNAVLEYNNQVATVMSWGQQMSSDPPTKYIGIGKYRLPMSELMQKRLSDVEHALLNNLMSELGTGSLLLFDFHDGRKEHHGFYDFSKGPTSLITKLYPAIEVYQHVLADGKPLISFYPSLSVAQTNAGFRVELTFKNTGEEPMTLAGPASWTTNSDMLPLPKVKVEAWAGQSAFSFLLTTKTLVGGKQWLQQIALPTGKSVTLTFDVPYSDVVFDADDTIKHIEQGTYTFAGDMKIDVLAPDEMKGRASTPIDFVKDVKLHARS